MTLHAQVVEQLEQMEMPFLRVAGDTLILSVAGQHQVYQVSLTCDDPLLTLRTVGLLRVPAARLRAAISLANALNARYIRWGAFGLDPEKRDLVLKLSIPAATELRGDDLGLALAALMGAVDAFFPLFARLVWASADPQSLLPDSPTLDQDSDDDPDDEIPV